MTKSSKTKKVKGGKKKNNTQQQSKARSTKVRTMRAGLDAGGTAYAKLLADPCNAPLAHPTYPGGDGGILCRFESEATYFAAGAINSGMLVWCPGSTGPNGGLAYQGVAGSSTLAALTYDSTSQPGTAFLKANASAARPVAACVQVYWPGSELNRQGFVSMGQVNGSLLSEGLLGAVLSPDNIRPLLPRHTRITDGMAEMKFRPSSGDAMFTDPSIDDSLTVTNGAIALSVYGIPVLTGVRIRFVVVYEYIPKYSQNMAVPINSRNLSSNSVNQVLTELDNQNAGWGAEKVGNAMGYAANVMSGFSATRRRINYLNNI